MTDTERMTPGRAAYEADLAAIPCYHDGAPRPAWSELLDLVRWSWERDNGAPRLSNFALAQAEWGMFWHKLALGNPEAGAVCAHNQRMNAMQIMALEAA